MRVCKKLNLRIKRDTQTRMPSVVLFFLSPLSSLDPFDCYKDKGETYNGLVNTAETGELCASWSELDDFQGAKAGPADFNYCRNPDGSKAEPWCVTVTGEEKICSVKKCPENPPDLEPWVAPKGSKGKDHTEGACTYVAPEKDNFRKFRDSEGRSCKANVVTERIVAKQWLIDDKLVKATDTQDCTEQCMGKAGAEYITLFDTADDDGNNCGCYRECVFEDKDLTIRSPNSFRIVFG